MNRLIERMMHQGPAKRVARKPENPLKPFDVDIVYAEMIAKTKNREIEYRGPYSPLYSAVYPVVCVSRVFGLAPYDFKGDRMTPSNIYLVFSFAFMLIYSYIMYIVFLRFISIKRGKSVLEAIETTKVIVNYLVVMYELISNIFTRGRFIKIWNDLQDYDEKLRKLGYPRKERSTEVGVWILLASQIAVWTIVNQSGMSAFEEDWSFNVSYMCTYVGSAVSVYKFSGMVILVGQRFHQLNQITRQNLPARVGYKSTVLSRKTTQELHNKLMSVAEELASLYSWSLLFWLFNLSVHSVSNLYFIFEWMISSLSSEAWRLILNMSIWLTGFCMQILAITASCDYTITEANLIGPILLEWDYRIMTRFPDDVSTSLRFLIRRLEFTAGGLFNVNLLLLCSVNVFDRFGFIDFEICCQGRRSRQLSSIHAARL
ncbi:uncharacterized protein LOC143209214 [Lasioglossum baleicum]|uniref:uncharacterized protein LOC143209214 n=1 Tax=Lasioglossum baleicum TaxID=434251 RepID=UPI003FCEA2CD